MWGPGLYNCYSATIVEIIPHGIDMNAFADDHALETHFKPGTVNERETVKLTETCVTNIGKWMDINSLKMNPDKTEIILCMDVSHSAYKYARRLFSLKQN